MTAETKEGGVVSRRPDDVRQAVPGGNRRRTAREAALKLLYAYEIHEGRRSLEALRADVLEYYDVSYRKPAETRLDVVLFDQLCKGVLSRIEELDRVIKRYLNKDWRFERLELLMRDTLRLGVYELSVMQDIAVATVINEYIDISRGFFDHSETAFVNALLDNAADELRVEERRKQPQKIKKSPDKPEDDQPAESKIKTTTTLTLKDLSPV